MDAVAAHDECMGARGKRRNQGPIGEQRNPSAQHTHHQDRFFSLKIIVIRYFDLYNKLKLVIVQQSLEQKKDNEDYDYEYKQDWLRTSCRLKSLTINFFRKFIDTMFFLNFKFELQFISNNEQVGINIGDCSMFWEMKLKGAFQQNQFSQIEHKGRNSFLGWPGLRLALVSRLLVSKDG